MSKDYCQEIADMIAQYRIRDRKKGTLNIDINKDYVEKWVSQFENHHDIVLQETANLLNEYYFTKENIEEYLTGIYSSTKIWGEDIDEDKPDATSFVYVDDCMFSGNTVRKDIQKLIEQVPNGSTINAIFIVVHSFAEWWVQQSLKDQIKQKDICFDIWRCKTIQNSGGQNHTYECLWPREYESQNVAKYLKTIESEAAETPWKKVRLFREDFYSGGLYTSEDNRLVFEQELMEAGLKIIGFSENQKPFIRPMGYDNRISFGFGAFCSTYMNMSNNCPLAFW